MVPHVHLDPFGAVGADVGQVLAALGPEVVEERPITSLLRPSRAHTSRPVSWSTTTVKYRCPLRQAIPSIPIRRSPPSRSARPASSATTRPTMPDTVRQETRNKVATVSRPRPTTCRCPRTHTCTGHRPGPRHLSHHHPMHGSRHPRCLGLQVSPHRAQIQRPPPPATLTLVVATTATTTTAAPRPLPDRRPHPRQHDLLAALVDDQFHALDHPVLDAEQPLPYSDTRPAVLRTVVPDLRTARNLDGQRRVVLTGHSTRPREQQESPKWPVRAIVTTRSAVSV